MNLVNEGECIQSIDFYELGHLSASRAGQTVVKPRNGSEIGNAAIK